jgi:hypothetical protein
LSFVAVRSGAAAPGLSAWQANGTKKVQVEAETFWAGRSFPGHFRDICAKTAASAVAALFA